MADRLDIRDLAQDWRELLVEIEGDPQYDDEGHEIERPVWCEACGQEWNDALISGITPVPAGRCVNEYAHEDAAKYVALCDQLGIHATPDALEAYGDNHDATLIAERDFAEYARDFAEDIGAIPADASWPAYCIDWERAARDLAMDYSTVTFDGIDYYIRG